MLLAVDIGNTNICFGIFSMSDGKLITSYRIETNHAKTRDEYFIFLKMCLENSSIYLKDIDAVIYSSVVPQVNFEFEKFCEKFLKIKPLSVAKNREALPIEVKIDKPEEAGADRLVNSIAAYEIYGKRDMPMIIIDFGTATTFDVIDREGAYLGGVICPGIELSLSALQGKAAKLPRISIEKPSNSIGKDTKSAMQSGIYFGYIGMIERNVEEISKQLGEDCYNIATGGLASLFEESPKINLIDKNLTLKGLQIIYRIYAEKFKT